MVQVCSALVFLFVDFQEKKHFLYFPLSGAATRGRYVQSVSIIVAPQRKSKCLMLCCLISIYTFEVLRSTLSSFLSCFLSSPSVQVALSWQPVKRTTCRTPATARSPPALVSVRWTRCQLRGLTNGAAAPAEPLLVWRRGLPPWSRTAQHTRTSTLTTASPAPGNWTFTPSFRKN